MNNSRYLIQPSFGYTSKIFDIAISGRLCNLVYNKINYDSGIENDIEFENIQHIIKHQNFWLFEQALTIRLGSERLKFQAQIVSSDNITKTDLKQEKVNLNFGFLISF
jgi:hypothetical protein